MKLSLNRSRRGSLRRIDGVFETVYSVTHNPVVRRWGLLGVCTSFVIGAAIVFGLRSAALADILPVDSKSLESPKNNAVFAHNESPTFIVSTHGLVTPDSGTITAKVLGQPNASQIAAQVTPSLSARDEFVIALSASTGVKVGNYTLQVELQNSDTKRTLTRPFVWDAISINTNQSVFRTHNDAVFGFDVFNDKGELVCNTLPTVTVTSPGGKKTTFSQDEQNITVSPDCANQTVTDHSAYSISYKPLEEGEHQLNILVPGQKSLVHTFEVQNNPDFLITRSDARLTHLAPNSKGQEVITVTPGKLFAGSIRETLPVGFSLSAITQNGQIVDKNEETQTIVWDVKAKASERITLAYNYQVPADANASYVIPPLEINQTLLNAETDGTITQQKVFEEPRANVLVVDTPTEPLKVAKLTRESTNKKFTIEAAQQDFRADETPSFSIKPKQNPRTSRFGVQSATAADQLGDVTAELTNIYQKSDASDLVKISRNNQGEVSVQVQRPRAFQPGEYRLKINTNGDSLEQDFSWGVLAFNANKSVYAPNEKAHFMFAVLGPEGQVQCGDLLDVTVASPSGKVTSLSTKDESIRLTEGCGDHTPKAVPDYESFYGTQEVGRYNVVIHGKQGHDDAGYTIQDHFMVETDSALVVERSGPTRIDPVTNTHDDYPFTLRVTANQDFNGPVTERMPKSFTVKSISNGGKLTEEGDDKVITWHVSLKKGESADLQYGSIAPPVSPQFYLVGPATIGSSYKESRAWQIAADPVSNFLCVWGGASSNAWGTAGNWTSCNSTFPSNTCSGNSGNCYFAGINATTNNPVLLGSSARTISGLNIGTATGSTSMTIDQTAGTLTIANIGTGSGYIVGGLQVGGASTTGTLNLNPAGTATCITINPAGADSITAANGVITSSNSNCTFDHNANQTITNAGTLSGTWSLNLAGSLTSSGTMNMTGGTFKTDTNTPTVSCSNATRGNNGIFAFNPTVGTTLAGSCLFRSGVTIGAGITLTTGTGTHESSQTSGTAITISGNMSATSGNVWILSGGAANTTINSGTISFDSLELGTTQDSSAASTYTAGGDITISKLLTIGNASSTNTDVFDGASYLLQVGANCTSSTPFTITSKGSFTASTSSVQYACNAATTVADADYYNLNLRPSMSASRIYTMPSRNIAINGNFDILPTATTTSLTFTVNMAGNITVASTKTTTINAGDTSNPAVTLDMRPSTTDYNLSTGFLSLGDTTGGADTLDASSSSAVITLTGTSGTLFTNNGTFTEGTSTVVMSPDAAVTLTGGTVDPSLYSLSLTPTITADRTYTFGSTGWTINGNFTINPTKSTAGTGTLTVNMGASLTVASTGTTTITGTTNGASNLSTNTSNALSTGMLNITNSGAGGTLTAGSATITLTGTGGDPLTVTGTFTPGTSTITYSGNNASGNTIISTDVTYANLSINNSSETYALEGTTTISSTLTLTAGTLDTRPSTTDYNITTGSLNIAGTSVLDAGSSASVITLTGTSGTLLTRAGTFTQGTSEVKVTSASGSPTFLSGSTSFHKLTIDSAATVINMGGAVTINNATNAALTITTGVFNVDAAAITGPGSGNGTFTIASGATFCLGGTTNSTSATCNSGATQTTSRSMPTFQTYSFDAASTVRYLSDAAASVTLTPTYGNVILSPVLTAARAYSTSGTTGTVNGDFTLNPSGAAFELTFTNTSTITVAATKTITLTGAGSATSKLTNQSTLSTGFLVINSVGTFDNSASVSLTLTGTSGTLLTRSGTYTSGANDVVKITSASGTPTFLSGATTFCYLEINANATVINMGSQVTLGTDCDLYINHGVFNIDTANLVANGTTAELSVDAGEKLCLGGTTNATNNTCDSGATQTTVRNLPSFTTIIISGTVRYLSDANQSVACADNWYNTLELAPKLTSTDKTYTLNGCGASTEFDAGTLTVTPSAGSALTLTVNPDSNIYVHSLVTITRTGSALSVLDLKPVSTSYDLSIGGGVIDGGLAIEAGATLDASGATSVIDIWDNYTNNGTFTAGQSTMVLSDLSPQTLSGSMTGSNAFYNLTITNASGTSASDCERTSFVAGVDFATDATVTNTYTITTANVRVEYNSGSTYTFNNINWNGQASGTKVYFRNSAASGTWLLKVTGTQTAVSYINVSRSDASVSGGSAISASNGTNTDCNNNTNWTFAGGGSPTFNQVNYRFGSGTSNNISYSGAPSANENLDQ